MKITAVRTTLYHDGTALYSPAHDTMTWARATGCCLVELVAGSALSGWAVAPAGAAAAVEALARDLLVGEDPRSAMSLWERTGSAISPDGDPPSAFARAALDIAVWDLKARANDEPLWKTLGGSRPRANAHLHQEVGLPDAGSMFDRYRARSAATGIRSGSLPVGGDPATDLQGLASLKQALGATVPESALMVHFVGNGRPEDAIRHIRTLESEFDLTWVRSPVRPDDCAGARQVADSVAAAVCMGWGFTDVKAYRTHLENYSANVLELDVALLGVSGVVQLADAAFGFELPVALSPHPGDLPVQLFSALPSVMSVAIHNDRLDPSAGVVVGSSVTFEDGRAVAGDAPGNGLVIDRDALRSSAVRRAAT
jgi:L-alanine-DL-glutamate epimerase-like enolase superfamily enzyme